MKEETEKKKKMHTSDRMESFRRHIIYALNTNSLQQHLINFAILISCSKSVDFRTGMVGCRHL